MAKRAAKALPTGPKRWHELEGQLMAREVTSIAESLWTSQSSRRVRYLRNRSLFEGCQLKSYDADGYYSSDMLSAPVDDPLGLIRSAIQTGVAEIFAKQKPKPQFQTSGADWKTRRKAQKMDKAAEAVLNQRQGPFVDTWAFMADAGVECLEQGTACIAVDADLDAEKIEHELVPCCELYVDPAEGRDPQNWFRVSPIDVDKAIALFAEKEGDAEGNARRRRAIENGQDFDRLMNRAAKPRAIKRVKLVRAWRLPFGKDKPGKVAYVIGDELMDSGEWTASAPPFVFLHWEKHRSGVWGSGIADQGNLAQKAGELEERLFTRAKVSAGKRTYYTEGSLDAGALELNEPEVAVSVKANMGMPQETVVPPFGPSELQYLLTRIKWFWDSIGISEVSAAARREPGVESGTAMRTLNDTKSGRQLPKAQNYERAFVDLGHQYMWRFRELAEHNKGFMLTWFGKSSLFRQVKVADFCFENEWSISVAPSSNLPNDPAGRQAMLGEIFAQKLISPQTYKQLLGWADLDQELQSESAEYEYVDDLIDKYLDAEEKSWAMGDYESPEGMLLDKPRAIMRFSAAYFRAKQQRAPAFNVNLLRNYILELDKQIKTAQEAQASAANPAALTQQGATMGGAPAPVQPMAA